VPIYPKNNTINMKNQSGLHKNPSTSIKTVPTPTVHSVLFNFSLAESCHHNFISGASIATLDVSSKRNSRYEGISRVTLLLVKTERWGGRGVRSCDATLGLSRSSPHPADGAAGLGVDPWNCCPQFFPSRNTKNENLTPVHP